MARAAARSRVSLGLAPADETTRAGWATGPVLALACTGDLAPAALAGTALLGLGFLVETTFFA